MRSMFLVIPSLLALVACSGGSGGSGSSAKTGNTGGYGATISSQFIDAPVKGLKYKTESGTSSATGEVGKFSCKRGELVTFSLGGLELGSAACGSQIFVQDLASGATNYHWKQAAAIIQTFSATNGSVLDLSKVDQSQIDLSALTFEADPDDLDLSTHYTAAIAVAYANVPSGQRPTAAVTPAAAESSANTAMSSAISISSQLDYALEQIALAGDSAVRLKGKLVKGFKVDGEEYCWENITALGTVSDDNGLYSFEIESAVSYDEAQYVSNNACVSGSEASGDCEMTPDNQLPGKKIITGSKFDLVYAGEYTDSELGSVRAVNSLSLDLKIDDSEAKVVGVFEQKLSSASYKNVSCRYSVSASTKFDPGQTEDEKPEAGEYVGFMECSDGNATTNTYDITAEISGTSTKQVDIVISDNGTPVLSKSGMTFIHSDDKGWEAETSATLSPYVSGGVITASYFLDADDGDPTLDISINNNPGDESSCMATIKLQ